MCELDPIPVLNGLKDPRVGRDVRPGHGVLAQASSHPAWWAEGRLGDVKDAAERTWEDWTFHQG